MHTVVPIVAARSSCRSDPPAVRPRAPSAAIALAVVVTIACVLGLAVAQDEAWDAEPARERLSALMAQVDESLDTLDLTTIDVGELAFELAFEDAESILATVRQRLAFEPYRGVLRGAAGALRSSGGNAFDQALLAATLLGDAGYDVQLLVTELDDDQASALLRGTGDARELRAAVMPNIVEVVRGFADAASDPEAVHDGLDQVLATDRRYDPDDVALTEQLADLLVEAVGVEVFERSRSDALRALRDDVRPYAGVRYRRHGGESWTEAHPAWRAGDPPSGLEVLDVIEGTVPERYLHRVRIEVFAERRLGGTLETSALIEPWERPSALFGSDAVVLEFVPLDGASLADAFAAPLARPYVAFAIDSSMIESEMFTVAIDGEPAVGALAFDTTGNVVPLVAALDPAAGVVRGTGRGAAEATGALGGVGIGGREAGSVEDAVALTGLWYQVTRIEPGGRSHTERRAIVDRLGSEQRAAGRIDQLREADHLSILTQLTLSVHAGAISQVELFERGLRRVRALEPVVSMHLDAIEAGDLGDADRVAAALARAEEIASVATLEALLLGDGLANAPLPPGVVAFRARPAVVVIERAFVANPEDDEIAASTILVDIHADPQRAVRTSPEGDVEVAGEEALRVGVWQTVTERGFVRRSVAGSSLLPSTVSAVDGSLTAGGGHQVLRTVDDTDRLHERVGPDDREAIRRDLERGFVIVIASEPSHPPTWWRVDTVSGETLGIGPGGRGQAGESAPLFATAPTRAKAAGFAALYVACMVTLGVTRSVVQEEATVPIRTCALPLVGVAAVGVTTPSAIVYGMVVAFNLLLDIVGFGDPALTW